MTNLLGKIASLEIRLADKGPSGHDWFKSLSPAQQAEYVKLHPDSKYAPEKGVSTKKKTPAPKPVLKDTQGTEPGDKDHARMQGIITRSKGDHGKMMQLVHQMANSIDDADKAHRRGDAAYHNLPRAIAEEAREVFHSRARSL